MSLTTSSTAGLLTGLAGSRDQVSVTEVTAGNMNRVFIAAGPLGSLAVKQAPPFVQVAGPGWPIDPARIGAEARAYEVLSRIVPESVPLVLRCDLDRFILVMEDLSELRGAARRTRATRFGAAADGHPFAAIDFEQLGGVVGRFIGELSRATSASQLGASAHAELVSVSANPELCDLTFEWCSMSRSASTSTTTGTPRWSRAVRDLYARQRCRERWLSACERRSAMRSRRCFTATCTRDPHGRTGAGPAPHSAQVATSAPARSRSSTPNSASSARSDSTSACSGRTSTSPRSRPPRSAAMASPPPGVRPSTPAGPSSSGSGSRTLTRTGWTRCGTDAWRFAGAEALRRVVGYSHAADLETLPPDVAATAQQNVFDRARHWLVTGTPQGALTDPSSRLSARILVVDLEGTTSAAGFILGDLYDYARPRLAGWLDDHADDAAVAEARAQVDRRRRAAGGGEHGRGRRRCCTTGWSRTSRPPR